MISAEEDQYFRGLLSVKTVADGKHQVDLGNSHITFLNTKSRNRYYEAGSGASEGTPGYVLVENYLHQSFMRTWPVSAAATSPCAEMDDQKVNTV